MKFIPFSQRYDGEFLSRRDDNFSLLLDKIKLFYEALVANPQDNRSSRRIMRGRFNYKDQLEDNTIFNQKGLSTEEISLEFADIISGCIRAHEPTNAFNLTPPPLLDTIAGVTLSSLYNLNTLWDIASGKVCLYEKKIICMLGSLVQWPKSDGFVTTGGKQSIAYAIRNGIARANIGCKVNMDENVVLCSSLSHFSIQHVCHYLGISNDNCILVNTLPSGAVDLSALSKAIHQSILEGKKIAAIIAGGGGTVNLVPDPIHEIKQIIDRAVVDCNLNYTPYLHVDSVITWAWLTFDHDSLINLKGQCHTNTLKKLKRVHKQLLGIKHADSFSADFHKTGLCPYAAAVFITQTPQNLLGLATPGFSPHEDPDFGEMLPFKQTFENSRSALPIVSIWIAIRKLGLEGFRQFILYQLDVCEIFKQKIKQKYSQHFEVVNEHSGGWDIVFKPHFGHLTDWDTLIESSPAKQQAYIDKCYELVHAIWYEPISNHSIARPFIGFVPQYSRKGGYEKSLPAFLIHPTSPHYTDETIEEMLQQILEVKLTCQSCPTSNQASQSQEKLREMVPPK